MYSPFFYFEPNFLYSPLFSLSSYYRICLLQIVKHKTNKYCRVIENYKYQLGVDDDLKTKYLINGVQFILKSQTPILCEH